MNIIELLRVKSEYLVIGVVERKCSIPHGVLTKVLKGERGLPDKYVLALEKFWNDFTHGEVESSVRSTPAVAKAADNRDKNLVVIDKSWVKTVSGKYIKNGVKVEPIYIGDKIYYNPHDSK